MDEQFQNVSHTIIDKFLDKVSESCHVNKEVLWTLWRDMFSFPTPKALKKSKPKAESKKSDTSEVESKSDKPSKAKSSSESKKSDKVPEAKSSSESNIEKVSEAKSSSESNIEKVPEAKSSPEKSPSKTTSPVNELEKPSDPKEKTPPKEDTTAEKDKSPKKKRDTCQFKLTRGERSGQECGKNVSKNSEQFCSYHCK
jgi:hypothetical protein